MFKFADAQHGVLDATRKVGKRTITVRARQMRLEKTGVHALVAVIVDSTPVHSDVVNIDRAADRHDYANDLYGTSGPRGKSAKFGPDISSVFPIGDFEQELMIWSRTAWNAWIGTSAGSYVDGDENPSAPPWSVPGLVMQGATNIWAGDAGANKSTLMRLVAQSIEHGEYRVIPIREKERCIWVNAEEPEREHTRQLGNVNAALGLPRTARMYTLHARGMRIADLATRLEKAVRETGAQHVFIDSLSRLSQGDSLNNNETATLLIDSVSGFGTSVNWIGHTGHENRERLAGSRHFENAARVMVLVQSRISVSGVSPELTRGVRARVYKANGAAPTDAMYWTFDYNRDFGLMAARPASAEEWPALNCGAFVGETTCGRRTWDGVLASREIRCARHRREDMED